MEVLAPAKINLVLDILGRRQDGYHEIRSLMQTVDLCDRLRFESASEGIIEISCDARDVPTGPTNLVHRAATRLWEHIGRRPGCRVKMEKRIPVGAGLGGGSSDAATALRALNALWDAGLTQAELARLGGEIGSDVPFFFSTPSAIVSGRGECVQPVDMKWTGWVALVMAGVHVSTRSAYARCECVRPESSESDIAALLTLDSAEALRPRLRNGLEQAVFEIAPRVRHLHDTLQATGVNGIRVSGAGSVVYVLFDGEETALEFVEQARASEFARGAVVVRTPAPSA